MDKFRPMDIDEARSPCRKYVRYGMKSLDAESVPRRDGFDPTVIQEVIEE